MGGKRPPGRELKGVSEMGRFLLSATAVVGLAGLGFGQASDADKLQGTWEITALVDDGALVPEDVVRSRFAQDGRFTITGQSISLTSPDTLQTRAILFVIDEKASPRTIDLAGTEKTGGKGIYLLSDDVIMICLSEPGTKERPTEFSAKKGSPYMLVTLKRVKAAANRPAPPAAPEPTKAAPATRPVAPAKASDDDLRKSLIGTWGHQSDEWVTLFTVNADGTFSSTRDYKKKFGKLFHEDVRSSGTWKLQDGVVLCTITASTDRDLRNQVFSYRIRSISATELIVVDQFGNLRREWRSR
jgi:uncharacterized protein (TIGR03067 family)